MTILRRSLAAFPAWLLIGATGSAFAGDRLSDAQQVMADLRLGPSDLHVIAAVDHADRDYRAGEPIVLTVAVTKPANVAVLRVWRNGVTSLVFPNKAHPGAQLAANTPLRIPDAGSSLKIAASQPGVVLFEVVAASRSGSWLFSRQPQGSAEFAELGATTRALAKDIVTSLKPGPGSDTAEAHLTIRVSAP